VEEENFNVIINCPNETLQASILNFFEGYKPNIQAYIREAFSRKGEISDPTIEVDREGSQIIPTGS